jgi:hypothetical protein
LFSFGDALEADGANEGAEIIDNALVGAVAAVWGRSSLWRGCRVPRVADTG